MKSNLKEKAINFRGNGFSYSEILKHIPVAKSTLSLWLKSVNLSKKQEQRLTEKKLASMRRGAIAKRNQRIEITQFIKNKAISEIKNISNRELWLIGISLYWAEGAKQKEHNVSQKVVFSNGDPLMIKLFLKWLKEILKIPDSDIFFEIYTHENLKNKNTQTIKYWSKITNSPKYKFDRIYYKTNKIRTKRKNTGIDYYGLLRICIKKSTNLNRKISGWIDGIVKNCGIVQW
ncbi:hypothetical protein HZC33_03045 [Candidatus Wolfebacteria bacterium]|nr:hypothetical protein [Candidatus Wolfebacteria bacterium]